MTRQLWKTQLRKPTGSETDIRVVETGVGHVTLHKGAVWVVADDIAHVARNFPEGYLFQYVGPVATLPSPKEEE